MYGVDCSENKTQAVREETDSIARYLDIRNAHGADIRAELHANGFYYVIETEGEGAGRPMTCSAINVDYIGRRFGDPLFSSIPSIEGTVFDQGEDVTFNLYNTIAGWQQALPMIGQGGKIHLYFPPSLAYGDKESGSVKPNTYLYFEITLHAFN